MHKTGLCLPCWNEQISSEIALVLYPHNVLGLQSKSFENNCIRITMIDHSNAQAYTIMLLLEQSNKTSRSQNEKCVSMALKIAKINIVRGTCNYRKHGLSNKYVEIICNCKKRLIINIDFVYKMGFN